MIRHYLRYSLSDPVNTLHIGDSELLIRFRLFSIRLFFPITGPSPVGGRVSVALPDRWRSRLRGPGRPKLEPGGEIETGSCGAQGHLLWELKRV